MIEKLAENRLARRSGRCWPLKSQELVNAWLPNTGCSGRRCASPLNQNAGEAT